jgi:imidazolonepropionase-like amidohydrolase
MALTGATLIDGTGGPPLTDAVVVVRRGKIESIGTRAGFELPRRTREIQLRGRWIIPQRGLPLDTWRGESPLFETCMVR